MKIAWYQALTPEEKNDFCTLLALWGKGCWHPGSLLFAPQDMLCKIVRTKYMCYVTKKLWHTCLECGQYKDNQAFICRPCRKNKRKSKSKSKRQ